MSARITALACAHELLDHRQGFDETITIGELLDATLDPYRQAGAARITPAGRLALDGKHAVALGLVVMSLPPMR